MQPSRKRSPGRPRSQAGAVAATGGSAAVRRGTRAVKERAADAVASVSRKVRGQAEHLLTEQKHRAASELQEVGESIRAAAGRLQDGPLGVVGAYVEATAERVSRASRYLEEHDLSHLVKDAEDAVRRVPQWFLPAMFLAGLAMARFAKATENETARNGAGRRGRGRKRGKDSPSR